MLESVAHLQKKAKKASTAENAAFQQLFLLVGMHLFKVRMPPRDVHASPRAFCLTTRLRAALSKGPR